MKSDKTFDFELFNTASSRSTGSSRSSSLSNNIVILGDQETDLDFDGMTIDQASIAMDIGIDELWSKVKSGQLLARTLAGEVRIYSSIEKSNDDIAKLANLPAPPLKEIQSTEIQSSEVQFDPTVIVATMTHSNEDHHGSQNSSKGELAAIVHHLNLAKEENREILKLTSESMSRLTQMTDAVINMKDELIIAREAQLQELQSELKAQDEQIRNLLREKENLETLAQNLSQLTPL